MNRAQFQLATGVSTSLGNKWYEPVEHAMFEFAIVSPERAACFLATIGHESGGFKRVSENLNYSEQALLSVFGKYYTPALAKAEARKPELIANRVYGGRMGNDRPGDGWRYRGRGLIQITGKNNYRAVSNALDVDYLNNPEWLERPEDAARASAWWWWDAGCNELADNRGLLAVSRRVNIGNANSSATPNGWADRKKRYDRAAPVLGVT